jgi:hypothetical protein
MKHIKTIRVHGKDLILSTYMEQAEYGWRHYCLRIAIKDRQIRWGLFSRRDAPGIDFDAIVYRTMLNRSRRRKTAAIDKAARYLLPRSGVSGREMFTVIKESLERSLK